MHGPDTTTIIDRVLAIHAPDLDTPQLLRNLFEETILFWRPADATVTRSAVRMALGQPVGEVKPGWLTYIADPAVADALPPDVLREPSADGVVFQAAEHPGTEADPDYLACLRQLRDALQPKGWLNRRLDDAKVGERMPDGRSRGA